MRAGHSRVSGLLCPWRGLRKAETPGRPPFLPFTIPSCPFAPTFLSQTDAHRDAPPAGPAVFRGSAPPPALERRTLSPMFSAPPAVCPEEHPVGDTGTAATKREEAGWPAASHRCSSRPPRDSARNATRTGLQPLQSALAFGLVRGGGPEAAT